jgi:hypothetical protein
MIIYIFKHSVLNKMLKVNPNELITGRTYRIERVIPGLPGIIFYEKGIFEKIIKKTCIVLLHSSHPWEGLYQHSYEIEYIINCYSIPRFSLKETKELLHRVRLRDTCNIQLGLLGKVPYEIGRLIASYV